MTAETLGVVAVVGLLLLILLRIPVAITLLLVGFIGNAYLLGLTPAIAQLQLSIWEMTHNFLLIALPAFILMGQLASAAEMGTDLYRGFYSWFGRIRGGLAITTLFSSAGFGAIAGSSVATLTTMGQISVPKMRRYHYDPALASGSTASAGVLAILIPPSIPLIFYSAWTETSPGDLFIAAIFPGLLLTLLFVAYVFVHCQFNARLAPLGVETSWREKWMACRLVLPPLIMLLLVLGSIYTGIATASEAAAIGVLAVLLIGLVRRKFTYSKLRASLSQSALLSANILLLLLGGVYFSRFLTATGITQLLVDGIIVSGSSPNQVIAALVVMYILLGAVLETFGMIMLTLPLVFPVILALGIDPIWFGIFIVLMMEVSLITPPVGIHAFVLQRLSPDTDLLAIYKGCLPFVLVTLILVAILVAIPEIALWLPSKMK